MASEAVVRPTRPVVEAEASSAPALGPMLTKVLAPLASLKLTVALFAMALILIFVGTLAQSQRDIWEVMQLYFRCFVARVELQVFFPRAWFPNLDGRVPGAFYFPGGFLIGGGLFLNLLAAHAVRFKVQARGARLASGLVVIAVGLALTSLVILLGNDQGAVAGELFHEWPSLRILWQLFKGLLAGGVLLAGCWLVFRKRAGIVLLHFGVGLMMANELVVHFMHEEGQMFMVEGQTVNYLQDIRTVELAVIDSAPADHDEVVVVPRDLLTAGQPIEHADLPFKIEVDRYLPSAAIERPKEGADNPATAGAGLTWVAQPTQVSTGADAGDEVDSAAAYVTLRSRSDNDLLGVYLLSVALLPQKIEVDGKSYEVALRFKRNYRPYSVNLIDVRKDDYLGTDTPRNYSSDVRLVDLQRKTDITPHISMNNPLRYTSDRIETFYQSGYLRTAEGETTTLQVVTNTGWMIPYVACMIVMVGLLAQFSQTLVRFLQRMIGGRYGAAETPPPTNGQKQKGGPRGARGDRSQRGRAPLAWGLGLASIATLLCGMWIAGLARAPKQPDGEPRLADVGGLPVVYEGRVKPFDTMARNALRSISGRQTFVDASGKRQPAVRWLLDVVSGRDEAMAHKVFYIENLYVLDLLRLKPRTGFRYALDEFRDRMAELDTQAAAAHEMPTHKLSLEQRKILELEQKLRLYVTLRTAFDPPAIRQESAAQDLLAAIQEQQAEEEMQLKSKMFPPRMVPPAAADQEWESYKVAWTKGYAQVNLLGQEPNPHLLALNAILVTYAGQDKQGARSESIDQFNTELRKYSEALAANPPADLDRARADWEVFYNRFEPLFYPILLYVAAFLIAVLSWLLWFWNRPLNWMALAVIVSALSLHTFGLVLRIWISGRPPVTNLYSSAIFIAWGVVVFGIAIELLFRLGLGNAIAGVGGAVALWIGHNLAADGDTFTVMQAVLDTNFWLATHVSCITFGYVATYVAGLLGLAYILGGLLTPALGVKVDGNLTVGKLVHVATYGVLCFAILFSFVGTVLGGLWADDSWGRFWGWDPKENGALIIVIWNALTLHARWGGMVKERGLAALAVFGNVVTSWSWFGVNELGVGLHSYGFTDGVLLALMAFAATQLAVIGFSLLPKNLWWSFRAQPA